MKSEAAGMGPDGNRDGVVNAADYVMWRNSFDAAGSGGANVPEPGWVGMLVLGVGALRVRRLNGRKGLRK